MRTPIAFTAAVLTVFTPRQGASQAVSALQPLYEIAKGWIVKSAEQMPEANYSFKPTPAVRSFGEIIGHVADATYMFCATAKGEKSPATQSYEKVAAKADLVKAVKDAFAYCDPVYKMPDASFTESAEMFGMKMTRLGWMILNVNHDNEHYGNLVTYFRLKGMVPPSSQPGNTM